MLLILGLSHLKLNISYIRSISEVTIWMNKLLFRNQVMSDSLWPHGLQHARLPYLSPSPEVCPSSYPLNWWCHQIISSSVTLFYFCLQSFLASGSFPMSWFFTSGGQHIWASASAPILPITIQGWFPLRLTCLISLLSKGLSRVFSRTTVLKNQFFDALPSLWSSSHICTRLLERPQSWLYGHLSVGKMISLLFNTLSRLVVAFLPRRNLIPWL